MDQVVAVGVLAIAAIVGAVLIIMTIGPSVSTFNDATEASNATEVRLISNQLTIVKVEPILDACAYVWLKNTGTKSLRFVEHWDVFLKRTDQTFESQISYVRSERSLTRCRFEPAVPDGNPCTNCWSQSPGIQNLVPGRTIEFHVIPQDPLTFGDYVLTIMTPDGVKDSKVFQHMDRGAVIRSP